MAQKKVCKLSQEEVGRLINYGLLPNCEAHRHATFLEAICLISDNLFYPIAEEYGLRAITECTNNGNVWKSRQSSGYNVRQFVRMVQG